MHLASWMPFARAAQMMKGVLGVQVSEATTHRLTERAGALAQALQTAQVLEHPESISHQTPLPHLAVSADGAYVPLLHREWAEVRTVAIGEVEHEQTSRGEQEVHVRQLSYFSRLTDAATFATLAEVEMRRRAVSYAQHLCALTDGADWLQGFLDLHCPQAVRILDFPHAAEHVHLLIQAVERTGRPLPADLLPRLLHRLKHRGPRLLMHLLERLPSQVLQQEEVREQVDYLRKRETLMQYAQYREHGWPIGSGMVESANKLVVQARLKGAGMHWERQHVNPLLTLRNAVCNERWEACWQEIGQQQARHLLQRRKQRAMPRIQQMLASLLLLLLRLRLAAAKPTASPPRPVTPAATLLESCRPSVRHPWKRPFVLSPKRFAKN